jgi:hypothetical protein
MLVRLSVGWKGQFVTGNAGALARIEREARRFSKSSNEVAGEGARAPTNELDPKVQLTPPPLSDEPLL